MNVFGKGKIQLTHTCICILYIISIYYLKYNRLLTTIQPSFSTCTVLSFKFCPNNEIVLHTDL